MGVFSRYQNAWWTLLALSQLLAVGFFGHFFRERKHRLAFASNRIESSLMMWPVC